MVSKKNFAQGGRPMPYRKPQMFKPGNQFNNNQMFNASQIPNYGYKDFNVDFSQQSPNNGENPQNMQAPRKKNQKGKQKNKQQQQHQQQINMPNNGQMAPNGQWPKNRNNQQKMHGPNGPNKFRPNAQRNFQPGNGAPMPMRNNMRNNMGRNNMRMPPMPPPHGFQRPPMMPPIPMRPMRPPPPLGAMPQSAPPFLRRSARQGRQGNGGQGGGGGPPFKKQMFPNQMPPMIPPMMANAPMPRMPMPFNNAVLPPQGGKIKKPNPKMVKKIVKSKSTIKTLKNLQNQYPLDKPWVSDEIRAEHEKKVEIENKLKGKKDDDLFAQFKTQRDKFVGMYETARDEYLKKEAAEVKTKDANGKETNNKTADNSGKGNENNENSNA